PEGSLADWRRNEGGVGQLPLEEKLELVAQVAAALAAAHKCGVIHADVKPSNILLRKADGRLQAALTDFGIGRVTDRQQLQQHNITVDLTRAIKGSSGWGTVGYLAPELQDGRQLPTTSSDIFALGVVLYKMVVGDPESPFGDGWERNVRDKLQCQASAEL